jgi:Ca-activated chloride channel homolog
MNPETNNARYTAYALNELDAAERARVEQELAANPGLRREVEEIRALSDTLTRALAGEPGVKLDEAGRAAIRDAAQHPAPRTRFRFSRSLPWLGAAAALLVTAIGLRFYEQPSPPQTPDIVTPAIEVTYGDADGEGGLPRAERMEGAVASKDGHKEMENTPADGLSAPAPAVDLLAMDAAPPAPADGVTSAAGERRLVPLQVNAPRPVLVGTPMPGGTGLYYAAGGAIAMEEQPGAPFLSPSLDDFPERTDQTFIRVEDHPLSTFSVDVDTASYSVVRKFLSDGSLPPADAVRVEELINYFPYDYAPPKDATPFAAHL